MRIRNGYSALLGVVLSVTVVVVVVGGCVSRTSPVEVACPRVVLNRSVSNLTRFHDVKGRDLTDIVFEVEIIGYSGTCSRTGDVIEMTLMINFAATRGPVLKEHTATWPYFVAAVHTPLPPIGIRTNPDSGKRVPVPPQAENTASPRRPMILAKEVFDLTSTFSSGIDSMHMRDEKIVLTLPMQRTESLERYQIFVGFQLTPEQLQANRQKQKK